MSVRRELCRAMELGTALAALTVAILSGCGGGSSYPNNGNAAAAIPNLRVTPGKGKMVGAMVTIRDVSGNFLGNAYTDSAGVAAMTVLPTATAPYIVSVSCTAGCRYFDERTMTWQTGSAAMPPLLAAVPTTTVSSIGVSAATHAAAQYAIAGGYLTPASITAVNNAVATQLGLIGGVDILTPPRVVSDAPTLALARAGATPADMLANYSATLAQAASGVTAIEAIAAYGDAWGQAAMVPASGVALPVSIAPAIVTQYAPVLLTAPLSGVASAVTVQMQQVASEVAAVNHLLADATGAGGGLREWIPAFLGKGGMMAPDVVHTHTLAAAGGNAYAGTSSYKELAASGWTALAPGYHSSSYILGAAGWQMYDQADTFVDNLNGTLTTTSNRGTVTEHVVETVLDGQPIVCTDPATGAAVACAVPGNYPAGAKRYSGTGGKASKDLYRVSVTDAYFSSMVTDMHGTALTVLPVLGRDSFCSVHGAFIPISNAATWTDNYTVYATTDCTAAGIAAATLAAAAGTVRLTPKPTGNSVVPTVIIAYAPMTSTVSWLNNHILASVNGSVMEGLFRPAGSSASRVFYANRIALDAELAAHGMPPSL